MRIEVLAPHELSADHVAIWRRFQAQDSLRSPFLSPQWVQALEDVCGPDRQRLRVAVLHDGDEPAGFLPARVSRFTATAPGAPLCDYQGLISNARLTVDPRQIVSALGVARMDFSTLLADQTAFSAFARGTAPSFVIDLASGYDAYAAQRRSAGSDILKDSAKKKRKLAAEHGEVVFTADAASIEDFDQLIAWKRAQYQTTGQTDLFDAGWPLELLKSLLQSQDPACRARLFTLHAGGALIAAHLALCSDQVAHAWFIAHDETFARYSPGVVLIAEVIGWAAAAGLVELDLGAGDYRFKRSLASRTREVSHGFVGLPSAATLVRGAAYRVREVAEALPLGAASALPGKAMRRLDLIRSLG